MGGQWRQATIVRWSWKRLKYSGYWVTKLYLLSFLLSAMLSFCPKVGASIFHDSKFILFGRFLHLPYCPQLNYSILESQSRPYILALDNWVFVRYGIQFPNSVLVCDPTSLLPDYVNFSTVLPNKTLHWSQDNNFWNTGKTWLSNLGDTLIRGKVNLDLDMATVISRSKFIVSVREYSWWIFQQTPLLNVPLTDQYP